MYKCLVRTRIRPKEQLKIIKTRTKNPIDMCIVCKSHLNCGQLRLLCAFRRRIFGVLALLSLVVGLVWCLVLEFLVSHPQL